MSNMSSNASAESPRIRRRAGMLSLPRELSRTQSSATSRFSASPETPLDVSTDGKQLIIAPAKPSDRRKKFDAAQELAHKRYGKAFRKLAE